MDQRRMCPHCRAFITRSDRTCPYCNEKVGPPASALLNPGAIFGGLIPHAHFTTSMILLVNFALFAASLFYSMRLDGDAGFFNGPSGQSLVMLGAKWRPFIYGGQWWRLVTAGFLHGGLMHILFNSWALFDLGAMVEEVYGTWRLLLFYFVSTVFGFLASTWWSPAISIGASAGVFGLIGAMIAFGIGQRSGLAGGIRSFYIRWAVYGLLFGLLPGLQVDNAAHLGGLAAGFGVAYLAGTPRLVTNWRENVVRVAGYLSLALTVLSFVKLYLWFFSAAAALANNG